MTDSFVYFNLCYFRQAIMADGTEDDSIEWLQDLLKEVQLEQFFVKLRDNLQVTRFVYLYGDN